MDYLGIDFSGNADQWRVRVSHPSVWIATLSDETRPKVRSLLSVQQLAGASEPFIRLADMLRERKFRAAGIDAPFSVPAEFVPGRDWAAMIKAIDGLAHPARPFPDAGMFLALLGIEAQRKTFRVTEEFWARQRINVRSTTWWKPRGGAPFAAACMKLIARSSAPCWPWVRQASNGWLVEAFPAAQLKQWGLPYEGYNGHELGKQAIRHQIVEGLGDRLDFGRFSVMCRDSADALDAVLAAFAGMAAIRGDSPKPDAKHADGERIKLEGWISVHC